ncbi:MAG: TlpA family protein disulfide reductase [Bdellovibrionaceae bacterium]|nr:TlpA family protein disulfide reductase [Pseudobdellovibrionaceae bacterium]MDW8189999.1 TlpA disulfide reductase family protein [Pseudobdellovibrionaceae bacterium]
MKNLKYFFLVFVVTISAYYGVYRYFKKSPEPQSVKKFDALNEWEQKGAPDIQLPTGQSIKELNGRAFIIHFWASWCGPCVEELPSLVKLARQFPKDLIITAISLDSSHQEMELFLKEQKLQSLSNFIFVHDQEQIIRKNYLINKIPESFILDRNFRLKKRIIGNIDWATQESFDFFQTLFSSPE